MPYFTNLEIPLWLKHTSYFLQKLLRATIIKIPEEYVMMVGYGRGISFGGNKSVDITRILVKLTTV